MQRKGSNQRFHGGGGGGTLLLRSRISSLMLTMFATVASLYVAGRLWQDAQHRVYVIKELDKITGHGHNAISVDDSLKVIACREQLKKLEALQMELNVARQEGFDPKYFGSDNAQSKKKPLAVIGILTSFGRRNKRDAIRKAWMGTGSALKKIENEKSIVVRFVIGRSETHGDSLDFEIDVENRQNNDFIILNDHVETLEQLPKKTLFFFAHVANNWDADFYAKVNDDIYVDIDALGNTLATHVQKPRVYVGCMKSGTVFSEQNQKWYEPEWWKFGDGKSYFRHASGEIFVISQALAKFVSINRSILQTYAHDDVSVGSWFIGLDVEHIDERKFCCSSWASGFFLSSALISANLYVQCMKSRPNLSLLDAWEIVFYFFRNKHWKGLKVSWPSNYEAKISNLSATRVSLTKLWPVQFLTSGVRLGQVTFFFLPHGDRS